MRIALVLCVAAVVPIRVMAQSQSPPDFPPHNPGTTELLVVGGYSPLFLTPNLPRGLTAHDNNHIEDVRNPPFLTGFAGPTPLDRVRSHVFEIETGLRHRWRESWIGFIGEYVLKVPVADRGRARLQQVNDPRPPNIGSFIYTKVSGISVGNAARLGVSIQPRAWFAHRVEVQGLFDIGKWNMTFEKGWDRFATDQPELTARANGLEVSPRARVSFIRDGYAFHVTGGLTLIRFRYDAATGLPSHIAAGWSIGGGVTSAIRLRVTP